MGSCCPRGSRSRVGDGRPEHSEAPGRRPAPSGGRADAAADRAYQVGFKRTKREDYAVDRLREARANVDDIERVNRILAEVGRFYNAIADAPLVSLQTRQRIVDLLRDGRLDEACSLIDDCLARYQVEEGDS
jgi:hypothetical protein